MFFFSNSNVTPNRMEIEEARVYSARSRNCGTFGEGQLLGSLLLNTLPLATMEIHSVVGLAALALAFAGVTPVPFLKVERPLGNHALVPLGMFRSSTFHDAMSARMGMTFGTR